MKKVIGIDPGLTGGIVITDGVNYLKSYLMPVEVEGKVKRVPYLGVRRVLFDILKDGSYKDIPVFLERAVSFGMGTKAAFNYGRGFEAVCLAVASLELPLTLVEPGKWTKAMHAGISEDIKAKAKSLVAVKRLYPKLWQKLPTKAKGAMLDGPMDALLIAGYGMRQLGVFTGKTDPDDFY